MAGKSENEHRDKRVLELYEKVLEIEQRLIPTGLHVFGRPSNDAELVDLLTMVASFDRPELGICSLPSLVARGLGFNDYTTLLKDSKSSEQRLRERERVEAIVRKAISSFISGRGTRESQAPITLLSREAMVA